MAYPNINGNAELLQIKTKDDQLRELHYKTEKHDHENILKSPKKVKKIMKIIRRNMNH